MNHPTRPASFRERRRSQAFALWLQRFLPSRIHASRRERVLGTLGAGLGVLITAIISQLTWGGPEPWFVAPMGAVAILLFAVPSSQLAQPWPALAGNLAAALIGVTCARWIPAPWLAAAVAISLVLVVMFLLHCLHPPAGGIALMAVLGGPAIQDLGYRFVIWPVAVNVLMLLMGAIVFNALTRRDYPNRVVPRSRHDTADLPAAQRLGPNTDDLLQSLAERAKVLDISLADLQDILEAAEVRAHQRRLGDLRCGDVMSRDVIGVHPDAIVAEAWHRLAHHRFRALPVMHDDGQLAGIVSLRDFLDATAGELDTDPPCWAPERRVRDIMTATVHTARPDQPIAELVPLLGGGGLHQVPVVDRGEVVGIVSQSDLVAALFEQGLRRV